MTEPNNQSLSLFLYIALAFMATITLTLFVFCYFKWQNKRTSAADLSSSLSRSVDSLYDHISEVDATENDSHSRSQPVQENAAFLSFKWLNGCQNLNPFMHFCCKSSTTTTESNVPLSLRELPPITESSNSTASDESTSTRISITENMSNSPTADFNTSSSNLVDQNMPISSTVSHNSDNGDSRSDARISSIIHDNCAQDSFLKLIQDGDVIPHENLIYIHVEDDTQIQNIMEQIAQMKKSTQEPRQDDTTMSCNATDRLNNQEMQGNHCQQTHDENSACYLSRRQLVSQTPSQPYQTTQHLPNQSKPTFKIHVLTANNFNTANRSRSENGKLVLKDIKSRHQNYEHIGPQATSSDMNGYSLSRFSLQK